MTVPFCRCGRPLRADTATWTGLPWWRCDTGTSERCARGRRMTRLQAEAHGVRFPSRTDRDRGRARRIAYAVDKAVRRAPESGAVGYALRLCEAVGAHEAVRILGAVVERAEVRAGAERTPDATWGPPSRDARAVGVDCAWCGGDEFEQPAALALSVGPGGALTAVEWRVRRTDAVACARCGGAHREVRGGVVPDARSDEALDDSAVESTEEAA